MGSSVIQNNFRARRSFAKIGKIIDIPNLIDIQKQSYEKFLQKDIAFEKREDVGLQGVFKSVFPIKDFSETSSLEFVSYSLDKPKYDVDECRQRGMTFAAPIKVIVRLVVWDTNEETGSQSIRDVKEQEVFFGEIPLMTDNGTFIINGTERVVVSQLHRSPGVFFDHDKGKTHSSGKLLYSARIIPYRGSWLDFEFDPKDLLYVRIDRRRKLHATVLLRALGYSTEELLNYYYDTETVFLEAGKKYAKSIEYDLLPGQRASRDIRHPDTREILVKKNRKFTKLAIKKLKDSNVERLSVEVADLVGKVAATDVIDEATGEVILQCNEELTEAKLDELREHNIESFKVLFIDNLNVGPYLRDTLIADKLQSPDEAIMEIYRRLRPGDPPTLETAQNLFNNLFFNPERYDLRKVGRLKLNYKFKLDESLDNTVLTKRDILETIRYLIDLKNGKGIDRRHRPPRQPPRARGRRAHGEPVPHRSGPHGARDQRAHEHVAGDRDAHAARPHQRQAGLGGGEGVLRVLAAVAVHGPDEPAVRSHAQAASLGPRARRSHARARRLRGARRSPHALRPYLPDRDAGRSEHRPHRVAVDLRPRQRVRLHRDAVPQGRGRRAPPTRSSSTRRSRRRTTSSPRRTPRSTRRASSPTT